MTVQYMITVKGKKARSAVVFIAIIPVKWELRYYQAKGNKLIRLLPFAW